MNQSTNN